MNLSSRLRWFQESILEQFFGFAMVKDGKYLDVESSFFRIVCFDRGVMMYKVILGMFFAMFFAQFMSLFFEWTDKEVDVNWLFLGQNQISLGVLVLLLLSLLNASLVSLEDVASGRVRVSWLAQWMLYVALLPGSCLSAIAYWRLFHGAEHDTGVQASKVTALVIMIFLGLFGMYEANWRHVLYTTTILHLHIGYVVLMSVFGNFVYASSVNLNMADLVLLSTEFTIYNVLIHGAYVLIQQFKVHIKYGGSMWKASMVPTNDASSFSMPRFDHYPDPPVV